MIPLLSAFAEWREGRSTPHYGVVVECLVVAVRWQTQPVLVQNWLGMLAVAMTDFLDS
jgi:BarA-like signal transduction histidine kinase